MWKTIRIGKFWKICENICGKNVEMNTLIKVWKIWGGK